LSSSSSSPTKLNKVPTPTEFVKPASATTVGERYEDAADPNQDQDLNGSTQTVRGARSKYGMVVPVPPGNPTSSDHVQSPQRTEADATAPRRRHDALRRNVQGASPKRAHRSHRDQHLSSKDNVHNSDHEESKDAEDSKPRNGDELRKIDRPAADAAAAFNSKSSTKEGGGDNGARPNGGKSAKNPAPKETRDNKPNSSSSRPLQNTSKSTKGDNNATDIGDDEATVSKNLADDEIDYDLDDNDLGGRFQRAKASSSRALYALDAPSDRPARHDHEFTSPNKAGGGGGSGGHTIIGSIKALYSRKGSNPNLQDQQQHEDDGEAGSLQKGSTLDDLDMDAVDSGGMFEASAARAAYAPPAPTTTSNVQGKVSSKSKKKKSGSSSSVREGFLNIARIVNGRNVTSKGRVAPHEDEDQDHGPDADMLEMHDGTEEPGYRELAAEEDSINLSYSSSR
jgi:hypothetical protein